jgi:DNA-binding IclR family transcriptional regulator
VPPTGRPAARRLAAVERAVRVLDAFLEIPGEAGTGEIARLAGINASTVSRILSTLVDAGYVVHDAATGRYRLGPHLLTLGHHALRGIDLRAQARPHLDALVAAVGETATLSVPGDPDAVTVDFAASPASVASVARIGRPSVAHATATGKAMLAFGGGPLPPEPLERYTPRTIATAAALEREVAAVRRRGHAAAVQEREPDLSAVAVPVRGHGGELVAILGVQGPAARFGDARRRAAVAELHRHAVALSAALGYSEGG